MKTYLFTKYCSRYGRDFFQSGQIRTSLQEVKQLVVDLHVQMTAKSQEDTRLAAEEENVDDPPSDGVCNGNDPEDFEQWAHSQITQTARNTQIQQPLQTMAANLTSLDLEMVRYDQEDKVTVLSGAVQQVWWADRHKMYPQLHHLACMLMTIPPSSIESERLFSRGSIIYAPRRNRLRAKTAETLLFINYNLRHLDKAYDFDSKAFQKS